MHQNRECRGVVVGRSWQPTDRVYLSITKSKQLNIRKGFWLHLHLGSVSAFWACCLAHNKVPSFANASVAWHCLTGLK